MKASFATAAVRQIGVRAVLAAMLGAIAPAPVTAHPHVWFTVGVEPIFDSGGRLSSVHEKWLFDYDYSLIVGSQLDQNDDGVFSVEELLAVIGPNGILSWIIQKDYLTLLRIGGEKVAPGPAENISVGVIDSKLTVEFTLPLSARDAPRFEAEVDVFDPEVYYDVQFDRPAVIAPTAPARCSVGARAKDDLDPVAVMIIKKLGLSADPRVLNDPALGFTVRVAIACG
ncbi:MAG: DUF1007 family protein [Bauldia sp.]